jgi:predicted transposase YdaD
MPYITSVQKIGEEIGFERGLQEGKRTLILHLLTRRFGELPTDLTAQIEALPPAQLESLGESLFDFASLADLQTWLSQNPNP